MKKNAYQPASILILMSCAISSARGLLNDRRGVALMEFALVIPLLMVMIFGAYEIHRFIQVNQKIDSAVFSLSDLITQDANIADLDELNTYFDTTDVILSPYNTTEKTIIFSSVRQEAGDVPRLKCQYSDPPGSGGSRIGTSIDAEADVAVPMIDLDEVVAIEMTYRYETFFGLSVSDPFFGGSQLYRVAYARPRRLSQLCP